MTDPALPPGQVTKRELATALGKSERTIEKWSNEHGMPRAGTTVRSGRQHAIFDLEECRGWASDQGFLEDGLESRLEVKAALDQAELRKKTLQGDGLEIRNAIARGEVIRVEDVEARIAVQITTAKSVLYAMVMRIEQRCGPQPGAVAREEVDRALGELAGRKSSE